MPMASVRVLGGVVGVVLFVRVVDVVGPGGFELSSVGTGHVKDIAPPADGIHARLRDVRAMVELRVPFELTREAVDSVERGADDPDLQPLKDAARKIAFRTKSEITPKTLVIAVYR